ncbi:ATP-binding protein [Gymnodinialimonas ceratoperidinii]|uniref:histidine kinase n=1 Tax=Gymnodinialimonas ceratoperidinii TaxID=2856823 RepID=A0A8F6Y9A4_9RHOB|nr:ATP-binding protein [Gymnodinialimonas ceratoperidinii]QXT38739.1 HAMP domain-containing protein [Gymnodinialimonas ceratoperidinii]
MKPSAWIKRFLPRSLYGRAALILIVPVVTIQLVVSSVFLQRHFEDVTRQLTNALSLDFNLLLDTWDAEGPEAAEALASALDIEITTPRPMSDDQWYFYDLSGVVVIEVLRQNVPGVQAIDLRSNERQVYAVVETAGDPIALSTTRRRASAAAPHQLLVIMVGTGILMTLVAYVFLRNQLRPIRRLAGVAEAFGKGRSLEYHPSGATEVRSAGRAFLDMRGRIEGYVEQRTLMLSGVSHDLRTPLTRMRLALDMMEDGADRDALIKDVEEMETLVGTFLDFVRGDALDDPKLVDPLAIIEQVVENARRGGGEVSLEMPEAVDKVMLRPLAIQRAVTNLVSNALRYGTRAAVTVAVRERTLRITVEDTGPGIPPEQREDALRPFIRLDAARNQNLGSGVGLGLAITQDITRRHGGSLALGESAKLGGLRVDLTLPR